ncbi:hypothetical protein BN8_04577 [Fibrisoma limi BUZ 3]|uniref:Transmembrane protein n=2 Tax=Fibrisoma limi TaxID=663275 RepID=I2GN47_9BACT|nr:hypothetical protein BN8_04577 [Fibrisoma limi BUZ 3]
MVTSAFQNSMYQRWTLLPLAAFVLSWLFGIASIVVFPLLLTTAQYLTLRKHPAVSRPALWFITAITTTYSWIKWGPVSRFSTPVDISETIMTHYAGQIVNSLCILFIVPNEPIETLVRWFGSTLLDAIIWLGLYNLLRQAAPDFTGINHTTGILPFLTYLIISLLAHSVSGLLLLDYAATGLDETPE